MVLNVKENNFILSLLIAERKEIESTINSLDASALAVAEEKLNIIKRMIIDLRFATSLKYPAEIGQLSKRYLFIKNYEKKEMFWTADCVGYTSDIAEAGTFSMDEAERYFGGRILSLADMIAIADKKESYAVTVADYISYQHALVSGMKL